LSRLASTSPLGLSWPEPSQYVGELVTIATRYAESDRAKDKSDDEDKSKNERETRTHPRMVTLPERRKQ
jgi:hypothetical protein